MVDLLQRSVRSSTGSDDVRLRGREGEARAMTRQPRTLTAAEEMRLFAGFATQPFVGALVAFIAFPVLEFGRPGTSQGGAVSIALATAVFAVPAMLVVVVPTVIWMV